MFTTSRFPKIILFLLLAQLAAAQVSFQGRGIQGSTLGNNITLTSVTVAPLTASINVTQSQSFAATAHFSDGSSTGVTGAATWSPSNANAVAQLPTGTFLCQGSSFNGGVTTITATYFGQSGTATLTCNALPQPAITTTSLPQGTTGTAYGSQCLTATGGTPPYVSWAETGSLPTGISFNTANNTPVNGVNGGCLSGTPTASGSFPLTFTVTDSASQTSPSTPTIPLVINSPPTPGADDNQYCSTSSSTTNNLTTWTPSYPNGATMDGPAVLPQACVNTALSQASQSDPLDSNWTHGRNITVCPLSVGSCNYTTIQAAVNDMAKLDASTGYSVGCGVTVKISANDGAGHQLTYAEGDHVSNGLVIADVSGGYGNPQSLVCGPNSWAIFETDQIANLPSEGTRITPAAANLAHAAQGGPIHDYPQYSGTVAPLMPKIISNPPPYFDGTHVNNCPSGTPTKPGGCPSVPAMIVPAMAVAANGATCATPVNGIPQAGAHLRFIGIEFATTAVGTPLVDAAGSPAHNSLALPCVSTNIVFDRVWAHAGNTQSTLGWSVMETHIGIKISSGSAVINSWVTDIHCWSGKSAYPLNNIYTSTNSSFSTCVDAQAVSVLSGGPTKVVNNLLNSDGEAFWDGGNVPLPSDAEIRRNHTIHPIYQNTNSPDYFCSAITVSITAWSITSNVATFTASNSLAAGQSVTLTGFPAAASFFNGITVTVLSSGLSSSQFEANFTASNGSGTQTGTASEGFTANNSNPNFPNPLGQDFYNVAQYNCPIHANASGALEHPDVKNMGEAKSVNRVLYEANILDQNWPGADQPGAGNLLTPKNQAYYTPGPATTDGSGFLYTNAGSGNQNLTDITKAFSPENEMAGATTGCQAPSATVPSYCDPTVPLNTPGGSNFGRIEYPVGQFWEPHPTSTGFTNGFSCSNPNNNALWPGGAVTDPTCATYSPVIKAGGSCQVPDPITGQCYFYPSVLVSGFPLGGDGWFISYISSNSSGLVTAYLLSCTSGGGTQATADNLSHCTGSDTTHDVASPPWTANVWSSIPYTVQWPKTGSSNNPNYPTTGFTGGGVFNSPLAGFNLTAPAGGFTIYFHDSTNCPPIPTSNLPSGTTANDCITYQSAVNSNTPTCTSSYTSAGQNFTLCGEFGTYPPANLGTTYHACTPGNDPTSKITNVTYRYNHIMHTNEGMIFSAGLSDCGDPSNGIHFVSAHDDLADDMDPSTYGTLNGLNSGGKSGIGTFESVTQPAIQLNSCVVNSDGTSTCTLISATTCARSGGTATVTTNLPHGLNVGQVALIGGPAAKMSIPAFNSASTNGSVITGVTSNTISYALSGTTTATSCSGPIYYTASVSEIFINHVTILPTATLLTPDARALQAPNPVSTGGMSTVDIGSSQPLSYIVDYTVLNSIGYGGIQSLPANNGFPNQCVSSPQNSVATLYCVVGGGGPIGGGGAVTASWAVHNNIFTGATIPADPYCSNSTVCPSFPGSVAEPNNGLYNPLPGDSPYTSQPGAGWAPGAPANTYELTDYTSIGFTNLASAGICYAFEPGTPVFGGGTGCAESPYTGTNPGVPNYRLISSSPYINGSLAYSTPWAAGGNWVSDNVTVTAWSMNGSNVLSLTAAGNSFTNGQQIFISGFPQGTATNWMNGQLVTVSGTGSTFTVTGLTHSSASGSDHGCASVGGFCDIGANIDIINTKTAGVY